MLNLSEGAAEVRCRSPVGRYRCKSRKSNGPKKVDLWTSLLLRRFSTALQRSVIDFGLNDIVPHVAARKTQTHRRLQEFSFATPKRLLQQNLPNAEVVPRAELTSESGRAALLD
jgi:hypothetical protein